MLTPECLDQLFPHRHDEAERLGINPRLREFFVPLPQAGSTYSEEQCDALFPNWRTAMKSIVQEIFETSIPAHQEGEPALEAC